MKSKKTIGQNGTFLLGLATGIAVVVLLAVAVFGWSGLRVGWKAAGLVRVIGRTYVGELDTQTMADGAANGIVDSLGDRWSYYMNAEEYETYQDYAENQYQGIGVTVQKEENSGGFLVVSVNKGDPADLAGIVADDIILAVDGTDVTGEDTTYLRELIQADFGSNAVLTIRHTDGTEEDISVSCEVIYKNPVSSELLEGNVGYIFIDNFRSGSGEEAIHAVEALREEGAESLLFDVRNNPGGQVDELCELLDYLLPEGDLFINSDKKGNETVKTSDASCVEMPMAVLVNGESYSAAEFFAAALREYGWATVVGEPTTGKARSQVTIALADGSALHISKYSYLTPLRNDLYEAGGIVPDLEVTLSEEETLSLTTGWLEPENDPQIQAALSLLENP